jgi:hypothetical protein
MQLGSRTWELELGGFLHVLLKGWSPAMGPSRQWEEHAVIPLN